MSPHGALIGSQISDSSKEISQRGTTLQSKLAVKEARSCTSIFRRTRSGSEDGPYFRG